MLNTKTETQFLLILFQFPTTEGEWIHVGNEFERKWYFPNCLGTVDGKHVKITPTGSGSFYWNYKGFNSLVLMSIANANYEFLYCDIGTNIYIYIYIYTCVCVCVCVYLTLLRQKLINLCLNFQFFSPVASLLHYKNPYLIMLTE